MKRWKTFKAKLNKGAPPRSFLLSPIFFSLKQKENKGTNREVLCRSLATTAMRLAAMSRRLDWMTHPTYSAAIEAWRCHSTILCPLLGELTSWEDESEWILRIQQLLMFILPGVHGLFLIYICVCTYMCNFQNTRWFKPFMGDNYVKKWSKLCVAMGPLQKRYPPFWMFMFTLQKHAGVG